MPNELHPLPALVIDKIAALGDEKSAEYFGCSVQTIARWRESKSPPLQAVMRVWDERKMEVPPSPLPNIAPPPPAAPPKISEPAFQVLPPEPPKTANARSPFVLCEPMYESVTPLHHFTLLRCMKMYGMEKIIVIPEIRTLIDEARNDGVAKFLTMDQEWLVMTDSDMILPAGNAGALRRRGWNITDKRGNVSALERLMSHPKEFRIVGAMYRDRRGKNKMQCAGGFTSDPANQRLLDIHDGKIAADGLEEQGWVGFGLVRIHRSVFTDMIDGAKTLSALKEILPPPPPREREPHGFFGRTSQWRGEDVAFCRRASMVGVKTYVDLGLSIGHEGGSIY